MYKIKKILLLIPIAALLFVSYTYIDNDTTYKEEAIDQILMQSLSQVHYSPIPVDDSFSSKVFKLYIERIDFSKKFLIQDDILELKKFEKSIDDDINFGKFTFFDK
jgi:carboxyl-terminal processing protease